MSYFRRLRGLSSDEEQGPALAGDESSLDRLLPYSMRAGAETAPPESDRSPEEQQDDPGEADSGRGRGSLEGARRGDPAVYDQLGEHVSTVLSSADEAAKRLQQSATEQAERIRAEAETYAQETRAAADVYGEERRESAQTEASAMVSDAENQAREVREAAELEAADIQRDAVRRRESLLEESERAEERLRNLLQVFRTMTERLEGLVGGDAAQPPLASEVADEDLAETLVAHSRSSAPATEKRRAAES
jgi:hypothetical protein